jgi:VWFA-related protein
MFRNPFLCLERQFPQLFSQLGFSVVFLGFLLACAPILTAQDQPAQPDTSQQKSTETPPEAGGPQNDVGPYAIPKKKEEPPPPPPEKPKRVEGMPDYSIHVTAPLVEVPVLVTTKDGQFIPNLKEGNFRVYEDGVEQKLTNFGITEAPITAVLLVEYAATNYSFMIDALRASYTFASMLKKNDWVAVVSYDLKPYMLVDFTQDKQSIMGAIDQLRIPGFSETNLFDALYDTLDRLDRLDGHKYIILVSTGFDSFSKLTLDQILKKVKTTHDVTIYSVSIGWMLREMCETHGCTGYSHGVGIPISEMDYLQADNEMQTFARMTGGRF